MVIRFRQVRATTLVVLAVLAVALIAATPGLSPDQVLYNFVGGSGLTGGPTLQLNNNGDAALPLNLTQDIFLDPNGTIQITSTRLLGRVFGGDSSDMHIVSNDTINAPPTPPIPEPATFVLLGSGLAGLAYWKGRLVGTSFRRGQIYFPMA